MWEWPAPPSTQFKFYLNFDTTSYTYRRQLFSLPCPHQLFFSLYGLFEVIRAARFAMCERHQNTSSWAAAASCCWKKVASSRPKSWKKVAISQVKDWKKVASKPCKGWKKVVTTMLKRKIINKLEAWKRTIANKALLIKGAHQVGKTTVVRQFAKANYKNFVEINFEQHIITLTY